MTTASFMGILSAVVFLIPVCIIIVCRLFTVKSLLALLIYFLINSLHNLIRVGIITMPEKWTANFTLSVNYIEVPLMLTSLLFFCTTLTHKKNIYLSIYGFLCYEVFITFIFGLNAGSIIYIMGPGILILFVYSCVLFSNSVKASFEKNKGFGKTLMIASIVFAYGCYAMVYCFNYLLESSATSDVLLIYYIASVLASILMSVGLLTYNKRVRQIKEVLIVRKELRLFFGS